MTTDEAARHRLHQSLDQAIGEESAAVLMGHLPPTGWGDIATRTDLGATRTALDHKIDATRADLEHRIDATRADLGHKIDALDHKIDATAADLRAELYRLHNRMLLQLIGAMAGLLSVFFVLTGIAA